MNEYLSTFIKLSLKLKSFESFKSIFVTLIRYSHNIFDVSMKQSLITKGI
jgi:hypothetical protein